MHSKDSFNCGIDSRLHSKYLVSEGKDFASFSKNALTNSFDFVFYGFDFIFGGFDFVFDGFDFDFDGFDFDFGIIKQGFVPAESLPVFIFSTDRTLREDSAGVNGVLF